MREKIATPKFLLFTLMLAVAVVLLPAYTIQAENTRAVGAPSASEIYLDAVNGNDANDGTKEKPVKTFAKAIEKTKDGDTLNVVSLSETNISFNKKGNLKFVEDVEMTGTGTGIDLAEGAHLSVSDGKKLTMSGYGTAIKVAKGA